MSNIGLWGGGIRYSLLVLLLGWLLCGPAAAAEDIAIVKQVQGEVTLKRAGAIRKVRQRDKLQAGDILMTGANAQVGVIFHDGSVLSLEEKSFLRVEEFIFQPIENQFNFKLYLQKGTALFESGKIGSLSPENFSFSIPAGTIGIRGTKFLVEVR